MEQKINTRGLVEAALMAVIITIILMVTSYIPLMYMFGIVVLPIPIAIIYCRHEFKYAMGSILVSIFISSIFFNPIIALSYAISYATIGSTLGYCIKNKINPYKTLILVMVSCIISLIGEVLFAAIIMNNGNLSNFISEQLASYSEMINTIIEEMKNVYGNLELSTAQLQELDKFSQIFSIEGIVMSIPGLILIYSFTTSYICFALVSKILMRLRYNSIKILDFSEFYVSNLIGAGLIAMISVGVILNSKGVEWALIVYSATMLFTIILMTINGMATVNYFLARKMKMPRVQKNIMIIIMFLLSAYVIFSVIGFVEMILDFRKLDPHRLRKV
ncbi:MAG: DUF2232 domain-containing protein [Terrisporobacter sp.]|uniref:DUF2232 domain-containing protein n=1 Tax=Clostridium sp. TaxID=1506 RepID=UPI003071BDB8